MSLDLYGRVAATHVQGESPKVVAPSLSERFETSGCQGPPLGGLLFCVKGCFMKRIVQRAFFISILLIFSGIQSFATVPQKTEGFVLEEKYPDYTSLPQEFTGTDIQKLYELLSQIPHTKSQYQTDADLKKQAQETIDKNPALKSIVEKYVIFTSSNQAPTPPEMFLAQELILYDAKKGRFFFNYPDTLIIFKKETQKSGTSVGQTAFGVKKEFSIQAVTKYSVNLTNSKRFEVPYAQNRRYPISREAQDFLMNSADESTSTAYSDFSVFGSDEIIKIAPDQASQHDGELGFLYVMKLRPPYISSDWLSLHKPTLTVPQQTELTVHGVAAELDGLMVYNRKSGEIIFRRKFIK